MPTALTARKTSGVSGAGGRVLLPYQRRWLADASDLKAWEKSRRIGADYTEAYDVASSRITGKRDEDYWYSSADESAAYEFAEYVRFWSKVMGQVADYFTDQIEDPKTGKAATAFCVRFPSGKRLTCMTSNPRRFRSKGGDVGLSELAFHDDERGMYDAALPCIMWGGRLRVLTTHNGDGTFFYNDIIRPAQRRAKGEAVEGMPFSVHRVTIEDAVGDGLVEKINETKGTGFTRGDFLKRMRAMCRNEDQWNQEFMAIPSTNSSAWLPYELIERCEDDLAGDPKRWGGGPRYLGLDVGELDNYSTLYWGELVGDVVWVRERIKLRGVPLAQIEDMYIDRLNHPRTVRGCSDATGLGTQIGQAAVRTGKGEAVKFTLPSMDEIASPMRGRFEDRRVRIPKLSELREDLHSIRMERTAGGSPRFVAPSTEAGHADEFWALGLMLLAAKSPAVNPRVWFA